MKIKLTWLFFILLTPNFIFGASKYAYNSSFQIITTNFQYKEVNESGIGISIFENFEENSNSDFKIGMLLDWAFSSEFGIGEFGILMKYHFENFNLMAGCTYLLAGDDSGENEFEGIGYSLGIATGLFNLTEFTLRYSEYEIEKENAKKITLQMLLLAF